MRPGRVIHVLLAGFGTPVLLFALGVWLDIGADTVTSVLRGYLLVAVVASTLVVASLAVLDLWRRH